MTIFKSVSVRTSVAAVWLRSNLTLTDTMVAATAPKTIFGLVPAGREDLSMPLNRISRIDVSTEFGPGSLLVAAGCVLVAISIPPGLAAGIWLFALVALVTSYRTELVITDVAGKVRGVDVLPLDREEVESFVESVNGRFDEL